MSNDRNNNEDFFRELESLSHPDFNIKDDVNSNPNLVPPLLVQPQEANTQRPKERKKRTGRNSRYDNLEEDIILHLGDEKIDRNSNSKGFRSVDGENHPCINQEVICEIATAKILIDEDQEDFFEKNPIEMTRNELKKFKKSFLYACKKYQGGLTGKKWDTVRSIKLASTEDYLEERRERPKESYMKTLEAKIVRAPWMEPLIFGNVLVSGFVDMTGRTTSLMVPKYGVPEYARRKNNKFLPDPYGPATFSSRRRFLEAFREGINVSNEDTEINHEEKYESIQSEKKGSVDPSSHHGCDGGYTIKMKEQAIEPNVDKSAELSVGVLGSRELGSWRNEQEQGKILPTQSIFRFTGESSSQPKVSGTEYKEPNRPTRDQPSIYGSVGESFSVSEANRYEGSSVGVVGSKQRKIEQGVGVRLQDNPLFQEASSPKYVSSFETSVKPSQPGTLPQRVTPSPPLKTPPGSPHSSEGRWK